MKWSFPAKPWNQTFQESVSFVFVPKVSTNFGGILNQNQELIWEIFVEKSFSHRKVTLLETKSKNRKQFNMLNINLYEEPRIIKRWR